MQRIAAALLALIVALGALVAGPAQAQETAPTSASCPAPLPGPRARIQLAYVTLLHRCPDPAGAATWESAIRDGLTASSFAARMVATTEARRVVAGDAVALVLGRPATSAERAYWADWHRGRRFDALLGTLAGTPEAFAVAGGTPSGFVDLLYRRGLGRTASEGERAYWLGRLGAATTTDRTFVARVALRSDEALALVVRAAWREILAQLPSSEQMRVDVASLRRDGDRGAVAARLVASRAFAVRADARAAVTPGRYVALGDSYVVGEGNPPYRGSPTEERCAWSEAAYPEVARTTSASVPGTLDVVACSGATLDGIHTHRDPEDGSVHPGQIATMAVGEAPSLVTLTIGGNDVGFVPILEACLRVEVAGTQVSPSYDRARCDLWLDRLAPAALRDLREGLRDGGRLRECDGHRCTVAAAVADVRAAAPGARVAVVGYPPLVPSDGTCAGAVRYADGRPALGARWSLAAPDVRRGRSLVAQLNALLRDAAHASGATYVDPSVVFAGHSACGADPWIHGLRLVSPRDLFPDGSSFHPNRRGGVGQASALTSALG